MSELPPPRCPRCKTVLSPQWRVCQVCKAPTLAVPPTTVESLLKAGDHIVYRDERTKQLDGGRVQRVVVQQHHLSITLDSGTSIQGRQICSVGSMNQDGTMTAKPSERKTCLCP